MDITIDIIPLSYYQYLAQNIYRKYITNRGRKYKDAIEKILVMEMENKDKIESDCSVSITFYFDNRRKNDIDNYGKPLLDFMSDIVYGDDRQIVDLRLVKFYDKKRPRIEIKVNPI